MSMSIPDCMNGETPAKRQKTNATSAGTTSNLSEDFEGKTYNCPSLLHLCVGVVASEYSSMAMHIVSSTTQLSDSLYTKITSMAFPTDEETMRLCCGIANVSSEDNEWDKGEELLNNGDVGDVVQSGFAVSATIHEDSEEWEDLFDSLPVYVYLNFERKILTSMRCSRCEVTFCRHQVAATLYRIRRADEVPKYKPVAEVLSTLGRNQLQTLLQYVISDDPATLMSKSFQHIGQARESDLLFDSSEKFLDPTSGSIPAPLNYQEWSVSAFAENLESLLRKCEPYFQLCSERCCYHKINDYSYHKPDCEQSHIVLCLDKIKEVSRFDSHLAKELICKTAEVIVTVTEDVAPNTPIPNDMRAFYQDFCDWSVMAIFQALPLSTLTEVKHRLENLTLRQHQVKKLQKPYQALTLPSLSRRFDDETPILENYSMASIRQRNQSGDKEQPYTLLISLIDYVHFQSAFDSLVIVNDIPLLVAYTESCLQFQRKDKFIASVVDLLSAVIKAVRKFTIIGTTILRDYGRDERHKIRDSEYKIMSTLNVDGEDIDMHWLPGLDFEHLPSCNGESSPSLESEYDYNDNVDSQSTSGAESKSRLDDGPLPTINSDCGQQYAYVLLYFVNEAFKVQEKLSHKQTDLLVQAAFLALEMSDVRIQLGGSMASARHTTFIGLEESISNSLTDAFARQQENGIDPSTSQNSGSYFSYLLTVASGIQRFCAVEKKRSAPVTLLQFLSQFGTDDALSDAVITTCCEALKLPSNNLSYTVRENVAKKHKIIMKNLINAITRRYETFADSDESIIDKVLKSLRDVSCSTFRNTYLEAIMESNLSALPNQERYPIVKFCLHVLLNYGYSSKKQQQNVLDLAASLGLDGIKLVYEKAENLYPEEILIYLDTLQAVVGKEDILDMCKSEKLPTDMVELFELAFEIKKIHTMSFVHKITDDLGIHLLLCKQLFSVPDIVLQNKDHYDKSCLIALAKCYHGPDNTNSPSGHCLNLLIAACDRVQTRYDLERQFELAMLLMWMFSVCSNWQLQTLLGREKDCICLIRSAATASSIMEQWDYVTTFVEIIHIRKKGLTLSFSVEKAVFECFMGFLKERVKRCRGEMKAYREVTALIHEAFQWCKKNLTNWKKFVDDVVIPLTHIVPYKRKAFRKVIEQLASTLKHDLCPETAGLEPDDKKEEPIMSES